MRRTIISAATAVIALAAAPSFAATPVNGAALTTGGSIAAPSGATSVMRFNFLNGEDGSTAADGPRYGGTVAEGAAQNINVSIVGNAGRFNVTGPSPFGTTPVYQFAAPSPQNFGFFGVGGANTDGTVSSATFSGTAANPAFWSISAYLGSINNFNVVQLFYNGTDGFDTYNGRQILQALGQQEQSNGRVTFSATGGRTFSGVRFFNNEGQQGSFEFDNLAFTAAVPEPATWAMMIMGFGLIGATMRRRRDRVSTRFA